MKTCMMLHEVQKYKFNLYRSKKVSDLIQEEGVKVDAGMHNNLLTIMKKHGLSNDDSDRFKDIF